MKETWRIFYDRYANYSFSVCVSSLMLLDNVLITIFRNTVPSSGAKQVVMPEISENI